MQRTDVDVGTCPAAAAAVAAGGGVGFDAAAVNIASDAAEGHVLKSTGDRKQKHLRRLTRRRRRRRRRRRGCRCSSPPAEHTNDAGAVGAEPEPAAADSDSSGPGTHSLSGRVMWRALQTLTSR